VKIYVLKDGLRYGPYSIKELRQQLDVGLFKPTHFASVDDCHSWTEINRLPKFAPQAFRVEVDKERNLLLISYRGRISQNDVERCAEEVGHALTKLDFDFGLLVDFSKLEEMDLSCASAVAKIMDLCDEAGVAIVVRVIPKPKQDIGLQIMSLFHYGNDVWIKTCTSMDEALRILGQSGHKEMAQKPKSQPSSNKEARKPRGRAKPAEQVVRCMHPTPPDAAGLRSDLMAHIQRKMLEDKCR